MKFSNMFEKLKIIFDMIINSNILIILSILLIAVLILRLTNKINNKKMGIFIYFIQLISFGVIFYKNKDFLIPLCNNLVDKIFLNFYFPSIYIYLFIFVVSLIIFLYMALNKFVSKTYKIITNTYFFTFNFIFILLILVITKNKIDIFTKTGLFTNNNALILLELSTLLFFIYLIVMGLVYFTNSVILFIESKKFSKARNKEEVINTNMVLENPNTILDSYNEKPVSLVPEVNLSFNEIVNDDKVDFVPEFHSLVNDETKKNYQFFNPVMFTESINEELLVNSVKNDILEEKLNFIDFNILDKPKNEALTLNDYKLFSNMLKTVIQNNSNSNLSVNDILNKTLLNRYSYEEYAKFEKILNSCLN